MPTRRDFLRTASASAIVPLLGARALDALERRLEPFAGLGAQAAATDQAFWDEIRRMFPSHADYVHLENGFSSPQPMGTFDAFRQYEAEVNANLSLYMRRTAPAQLERVRKELADLAGVPVEELLITRNTTESLGTVIHGLDYAPGDEAVMCDQDYGSMLHQFRQESRRHGLKLVELKLPLHPKSDEELVELYAGAITVRTKVLLLTHVVNITGQILPVKKIADMAHSRGVMVVSDSAHAFAHLDFTLPQLGVDAVGASLHKWLCTPLGAGLLHIRKDRIASVWPLMGDVMRPVDDIRKLDRTGTRPAWTVLAISDAIRFHRMVGAARKEARLRWLQEYWTSRVDGIPKAYLNTPKGARACAIANVGITGLTPQQLATRLWDDHRVYVQPVANGAVQGVRVTPHLFTTTTDLDRFVTALRAIAAA